MNPDGSKSTTSEVLVGPDSSSDDFVQVVWADGSKSDVPQMTVGHWQKLQSNMAAGRPHGKQTHPWSGQGPEGPMWMAFRKDRTGLMVVYENGKQIVAVPMPAFNHDQSMAVAFLKPLVELYCAGTLSKPDLKAEKKTKLVEVKNM